MITDLLTSGIFGEMRLRDHLRYVGPGTKIEDYVSNLPQLLEHYNTGQRLDTRMVSFKQSIYEPCTHLDWHCMLHDVYYWIGEQKKEHQKRIQRLADEILIDALTDLVCRTKSGDPEHNDSLIVLKLIRAKISVENNRRKLNRRDICCGCTMS